MSKHFCHGLQRSAVVITEMPVVTEVESVTFVTVLTEMTVLRNPRVVTLMTALTVVTYMKQMIVVK